MTCDRCGHDASDYDCVRGRYVCPDCSPFRHEKRAAELVVSPAAEFCLTPCPKESDCYVTSYTT